MNNVLTKSFPAPPFDEKEAMLYAGYKEKSNEARALIRRAKDELEKSIVYKVCYKKFDLRIDGDICFFDDFSARSANLARRLAGCRSAVIFAATLGTQAERQIKRYSSTAPAEAIIIGAVANERIESLCDAFCEELGKKYGEITERYSPGYGDLALDFQKSVFEALSPEKNIGLYLSESLLMTPVKSVTAIVGIK